MVNFVWIENNRKETKLKNLLIVWVLIWFVSIAFHFTVVFFFWLILDSIFLVWLFLAIWNVFSLAFDIPIWVLQKYIKPKTFMIIWSVFMLVACLIFFKFIYLEWMTWALLPWWKIFDYFSKFMDSFTNIFLLFLAAGLYWLISEIYWVTSFSYILDNTSPSEYAKYLSRYNIFSWIWSMAWLVFSWVLLFMNIKIAIMIFIAIVVFSIWFLWKFFDNGDETLTLNSLKKLKIDSFKLDMWKKKSKKISQVISTKNLMDLTKKTKVIFIKPIEANKKIDWKEIYDYTILNFKRFIKILFSVPRNLMILWLFFILMQFSFWDTFVSTFFVQYIKDVTDADSWNQIIANTQFISWYAWLWIIAIPWFLLQDPFINLSKKFWEFNILMLWAFLSGVSLVLFWFYSKDFTMILILWLINSVWYAAVIWVWQWLFSERYNVLYALKNSLKQIDSTVSAAPLKIILNLANVIWLILWAFIVQTMWFEAFFIGFGWLLLWLFIFSIVRYKAINDSWKEWDWMFAWTEEIEKHTKEIEEFDGEVFT